MTFLIALAGARLIFFTFPVTPMKRPVHIVIMITLSYSCLGTFLCFDEPTKKDRKEKKVLDRGLHVERVRWCIQPRVVAKRSRP